MSRDKGNRAPAWWAIYLQSHGFPHAEKTPNGLNGRDILGTPGVAWEVKTSGVWRKGALDQAVRNADGDLPVVVYYPPGIGEHQSGAALCVLLPEHLMGLLEAAGYTGEWTRIRAARMTYTDPRPEA